MYLDGQLPRGPASINRGGQVTSNAVSALFDGEMGEPIASPLPQDLSGSTFFTLPDGGPVVVSPSLATVNGIVQTPVNPMRGYQRGDNTPVRLAPAGYAPQNPDDWEPAADCGLAGLGAGAGDGGMSPEVFKDHFGVDAPNPATCRRIQCGELTQAEAGPELLFACGNFGYAGPRSCRDPLCVAGCPAQMIEPGAAPMAEPVRLPVPAGTPLPNPQEGCFEYGADGSLVTVRNDAGRNGGLDGMEGGCCQSGYHSYDDLSISESDGAAASPLPWLLGIAGAALLLGGSIRKAPRRKGASA